MNAAVNDHEETSGPLLAGDLEVRLAQNEAEIDAAQSLRYRVFYEEMGATPSAEVAAERRDFDQFDDICDHLLVVDRTRGLDQGSVVGTYRLLRKSQAKASGRFYTADEYDISCLLAHEGEILELGRSCVDAAYRDRATVQLLLRGIGAYVRHHDITLMFGCASLPGVEAHDVAVPLSWLHYNRLAPPALRPRALPERYVRMNLVPREAAQSRIALAALPPLIKAYVRAGCFVGDGAVIDHQFRTIDICIVLEVDRVSDRFRHRYEGGAGGGHAGRA